MSIKALKQALALAFVMAFLVGCSSTDTKTNTDANDNAATTGTSSSQDLGSSDGTEQQAQKELATVVYFDFDQAVLKPQVRSLLLEHAERLRGTDTHVRLEGHTDERGSREYNMALGERRANAVRDFLVLQGVNRDNIDVVSYGEERPAVMGTGEAVWSKNRRVEIKY